MKKIPIHAWIAAGFAAAAAAAQETAEAREAESEGGVEVTATEILEIIEESTSAMRERLEQHLLSQLSKGRAATLRKAIAARKAGAPPEDEPSTYTPKVDQPKAAAKKKSNKARPKPASKPSKPSKPSKVNDQRARSRRRRRR